MNGIQSVIKAVAVRMIGRRPPAGVDGGVTRSWLRLASEGLPGWWRARTTISSTSAVHGGRALACELPGEHLRYAIEPRADRSVNYVPKDSVTEAAALRIRAAR